MALPTPSITIPIAQLGPGLESIDNKSVRGVVTLVWPYASSTKSLSLLLVEPDFRLRRQQGQVRIHLQGSSARAITKASISSGDTLLLSLQGASWAKDATTAATPGRSIEWELQYGERVLLEIQRPGHIPVYLDVNHPPLSPEPTKQASSPLGTQLYNSHLPSSTQKQHFPSLNGNDTWSSPAFQKRSHFTASSYDPFMETGEEFPDNARRKRTKFGRASGEWRFAGNTPSPEKDHEELVSNEAPSSPLRAMEVDETGQKAGQQVMLATPPTETRAPVPGVREAPAVGAEFSDVVEDAKVAEPGRTANVDFIIDNNRISALARHDASLEDDERIRDAREESHRDQDDSAGTYGLETADVMARVLERSSSAARESSRSPSPAGESVINDVYSRQNDSSSEAVWSGSASEFGLDGIVMSRTRQAPPQTTLLANELGRRWVEMQEAAPNSSRADEVVPSLLGQMENAIHPTRANFSTNTGHQTQVERDKESNQEGQKRTRDEETGIPEDYETPLDEKLQAVAREWVEKTTMQSNVHLEDADDEKARFDEPPRLKERGADPVKKTTTSEESDEEQTQELEEPFPATIQDSADLPQRTMEPPSASRVEVINLESDDEDYDQQYASEPVISQDALRSLHEGMAGRADNEILSQSVDEMQEAVDEADESDVESNDEAEEPDFNRPEVLDNDLDGPTPALDTVKESLDKRSVSSERPSRSSSPSQPLPPSEIPSRLNVDDQMEEDITYPELQPGQEVILEDQIADFEASYPDLLSSVQDTFEDSFTSQLLTPDDLHLINVEPQPSISSLRSNFDEETLPTPGLTQGTSAGIIVPDGLEYIEFQPTPEHAPTFVLPNEQAEMDDVPVQEEADKEMLPKTQAKRDVAEISENDVTTAPLNIPAGELKIPSVVDEAAKGSVVKSPPAAQANPGSEPTAPEPVSPQEPARRESQLITRVKEMRRISSQRSGKRLSGSGTASPWFAPRRSTQPVRDSEVETDSHIASSENAKKSAPKTPLRTTPEKSDKRLSQSFIRSSPVRSPPLKSSVSSPQESQYVPPSQPPTGFRTSLSYFVPLASLHSHYGTEIDILAVAIFATSITRAKSGPKDYNQTIYLTDPSSATTQKPATLTTAQIFRPRKNCFPNIILGDAILLRNFKVQSFQKRLSLISTESSGWAVFRKDTDVQIRGPPVEYGPEERAFARGHWTWWASLSEAQTNSFAAAVPRAKAEKAKPAKKGLGFEISSSQKKAKQKTTDSTIAISLRERLMGLDNSADAEAEEEKAATQRRVLRPRKGRARASVSPAKDAGAEVEEIHELRDGTRYVDRQGVGVEEVEAQTGVHELRDGTRYRGRKK